MTYVAMKISGMTIDNTTYLPLLTLRSEELRKSFPMIMKREEQDVILNSLVKRNSVYSNLLKQLVWQQSSKIIRITIEDSDDTELVSKVYLKKDDHLKEIILRPVEGIVLAIEFAVDISVSEKLISQNKYFKRKMEEEELLCLELEGMMDQSLIEFEMPFGPKRKKETLQ